MSENPRQFSSIDSSEAGLYGSLTNRPSSAAPANQAIDYAKHFDVERQVIDFQKQNGTYQPRSSDAELALQAEQKAAQDAAWRQSVQEAKAAQEIQAQREQALRTELLNRLRGEASTPSPYSNESDRNRIRRMNDLPPIEDPPPSTPDRQPLPSRGSPPPTPNGTAARASSLVEPTATPAPAAVKEAISPTVGAGLLESLPRSLPQAAGRLVVPGVTAGLTFAGALIAGQSVQQAATTAAIVTGASVAGGLIGTAIAGPIGGYIGSVVGGYAGGLFSDWLMTPNMPTTAAQQETYTPRYVGKKGQTIGAKYRVTFSWDRYFQKQFIETMLFDAVVTGPIQAIDLGPTPDVPLSSAGVGAYAVGTNLDGSDMVASQTYGYVGGSDAKNLLNLSVVRVDGNPEIYPATTPQPPPDNLPSGYDPSPVGNDNTVPSGIPSAGANKGATRNVAPSMPSNNRPNGSAFFPGHGGLAPSNLPNPTQTPSNLGGGLPANSPSPQPPPFADPGDSGVPVSANGSGSRIEGGVVTQGKSVNAQAIPLGSSSVKVPSPSPTTGKQNPTPDALAATPKAASAPTPNSPDQPTTDKLSKKIDDQGSAIGDLTKQLITIGGILAGLTPIVQGIPDAIANSPAVKAATQGAVCEITQPGGCLGNALDDTANKVNQNNNQNTANLLDKINAGANAAQLALLELINTKLGAQLTGGISGFLQNFFDGFNKLTEWLHLDRALNLLTFIMTVQNVYFLCDSMKVVTLQMISDTLAVFGIKDKDNNPLNLNEILGHEVESLLKSILGEQELTGMKQEWKALNRIFQAATNMLFAIQNMVFSVLQALEIIGSWNASIGNALKKYLVVGQNAFNWMNPNPNFHNNFFKFLGEALNVVTSLDFVAQSILQGRQAIDDFGKQTDDLTKSIGEASDGFKPPENKATAEAATASANVSKSPIPSPEDVNGLQ